MVDEGACRLRDGTLVGSIFPLLEGCIKLASWTGDPSAAIWSAIYAPRQVLAYCDDPEKSLVGKSLPELLRWKFNSFQKELSWRQAD